MRLRRWAGDTNLWNKVKVGATFAFISSLYNKESTLCLETGMTKFHYRVHDDERGVVGDYDFEESDVLSAYRVIFVAAALFVGQGFAPNAWLELEDDRGVRIAKVSLKSFEKP